MPAPFIITLPVDEDEVRQQIEEQLGSEAVVRPAPQSFAVGPEEIKLFVEIVGGGLAIVKTLLEIKRMYAARGKPTNVTVEQPGKGSVKLDEADEELLRRLLLS